MLGIVTHLHLGDLLWRIEGSSNDQCPFGCNLVRDASRNETTDGHEPVSQRVGGIVEKWLRVSTGSEVVQCRPDTGFAKGNESNNDNLKQDRAIDGLHPLENHVSNVFWG